MAMFALRNTRESIALYIAPYCKAAVAVEKEVSLWPSSVGFVG